MDISIILNDWPYDEYEDANNIRIVSTSLISGRLCKITGSSVSKQAANIGRAAFLLPDGRISPFRGYPPLIINFSIPVSLELQGNILTRR